MDGTTRVFLAIGAALVTISFPVEAAIEVVALSPPQTASADTDTCENIQNTSITTQYGYNYDIWPIGLRNTWYNMSFWGGHSQIPTKDNLDNKCFASAVDGLVVLLGKHPDIENIGNEVIKLDACSLNRKGLCIWNFEVKAIKCDGTLYYSSSWLDPDTPDILNHYICFDAIYTDTCSETDMLYSSGNIDGNIIHFSHGDVRLGWFNGFIKGTQYILPSTEDLETVFNECFHNGSGNVLQEPMPQTLTETPVRLAYCEVNNYFNDDGSYFIGYDEGNCHNYVYVRACNGHIQFDLSEMHYLYYQNNVCIIQKNNIFVNPEIRHNVEDVTIDGVTRKTYSPFLQYKCSFEMTDGISYKINWYINGTLQLQTGPSSLADDLVFKENYLTDLSPGYEVQCGVTAMSENLSNESLSDVFYAGWKRSNGFIQLSKNGFAVVELEQTIPLGCYYLEDETPDCLEELSLVEPSYNPGSCAGTIRVQNDDDPRKSYFALNSLKDGEEWKSRKYKFRLSTVDSDYDDQTSFNLEMFVNHSTGHAHQKTVRTKIVGAFHIDVKDYYRHWNKKCYSHVDPHHKTPDGLHFEMQRECDGMMYLNEAHQTEIQHSARYCSPGRTKGPVCACGIAIRVGADAFVINTCPDSNLTFDYIRKDDGGIIDIVNINDYYYKVTLPIGTIVDIFLHVRSNTMNIDIYMAAKDFGNVVGLCGYFDGNRTNDLLHRDRVTVSTDRNRNYAFSDSWKLTDEENLFKNPNRFLEPLNVDNAGGSRRSCSRPNSITRKKLEATRRRKRSLLNRHREEPEDHYRTQLSLSRTKRSMENFTEDEAYTICNASIYVAPAVQEFPDRLGEEDLTIVVEQCVYDLTNGNDTQWVDAHITVLNNAADAILRLNPVFVTNNSDMVESFRTEICLNNCSQNGVCTKLGYCECNGVFRGPDCSIDIRIPPIVYEVQGGDICNTDDGDDCACHQIRTDNIFEGFLCQMIKYKVYFNGTRIHESNETFEGDYQDIFTGVCCYSGDRKKRSSDDNDTTVTMYEFSVSNDGNNYGEPNAVYIYKTTCIEQDKTNGAITFKLKNDFCFIDGACFMRNDEVLSTDECYLCDPTIEPYAWTHGVCEEITSTGLEIEVLIGIIIGSFLAVIVAAVLIYLMCCKKAKTHTRTVPVGNTRFQSALTRIQQSQSSHSGNKRTRSKGRITNAPEWTTHVNDINFTDEAKPVNHSGM